MIEVTLSDQEIREIQALSSDLASRYASVEDPEFLREAALAAHDLPRRLRELLLDFKTREPECGVCILRGFPIDEARIGETPKHWSHRLSPPTTLREEIIFVLFSLLLGEPLAWATQQDGHLMHDILPIQGHEQEQLGSGSEQLLWWHTEDAFHPHRGDYIAMFCLRNHDGVATTIGALSEVDLTAEDRRLLSEEHYTIKPDESHLPKNRGEKGDPDPEISDAYQDIDRMQQRPEKLAVLFGDSQSPYARLDPYFMDPVAEPPGAQVAFDRLVQGIDNNLQDMVLRPGDLCFIDNFRVVHGRKPFRARFDGRDRCLKRLNITRDLRKSRAARQSPDSRVIL